MIPPVMVQAKVSEDRLHTRELTAILQNNPTNNYAPKSRWSSRKNHVRTDGAHNQIVTRTVMSKISERLLSPHVITSAKYATGYDRSIEHLKAWKVVLPGGVAETTVSLSESGGPRHLGTK